MFTAALAGFLWRPWTLDSYWDIEFRRTMGIGLDERWGASQAVCHVENLGREAVTPCIFVVVLQKWQNPLARKLGRPLCDIYLRGVSSPLAAKLGE